MLAIRFIRQNPEVVRAAIRDKAVDLDLDALLEADTSVRGLKQQIEQLAAEKNRLSKSFGKVPAEERAALITRSKAVGAEMTGFQADLRAAEAVFEALMWRVPNIPAPDVPIGKADEDNVVLRTVGDPTHFDFEPLDHVDLVEHNGWGEFARVAHIAGSRSYALKGDLARLELALHLYTLDMLADRGFTAINVPALAREEALYGTGHFPAGREDVYAVPKDDLYLSGTAEIVLTSLHRGEILDEADLPIRYAGYSPCFRREAGSFGRDVRGLLRVHQFYKVEQYVICKNDPEESARWHAELLGAAEAIVASLDLPYRVVECCTGEMGTGKFRMNDIEVWLPSLDRYRETHSCSSLHAWQARRADLRYRDAEGKVRFVHTLNNTGIATPRILAPLLEIHQTADHAVRLPAVLQPYMRGRATLGGPTA